MNKGIITRYKFSKLEIAEQLSTLDLEILPQEIAFNLKVDREYKFASVDTCYQHKASKSFSTQLFLVSLKNSGLKNAKKGMNFRKAMDGLKSTSFLATDNLHYQDQDSNMSVNEIIFSTQKDDKHNLSSPLK